MLDDHKDQLLDKYAHTVEVGTGTQVTGNRLTGMWNGIVEGLLPNCQCHNSHLAFTAPYASESRWRSAVPLYFLTVPSLPTSA